jgi:pimeloyl-[acyl-carrier protein] synthase
VTLVTWRAAAARGSNTTSYREAHMTTPANAFADASEGFFTTANSPEFRENPYAFYAMLRENTPRLRTEMGLWFLTTHADASMVLRDPRNSSDESHSKLHQMFVNQMHEQGRESMVDSFSTMLFMDPPDHTRLRGLVQQAFTPRMVEQIRPRAQQLVDELIDAAVARDTTMDLVEDVAYPLPVTIICELLGVPVADHDRFAEWSRTLSRAIDPSPIRSAELEEEIAMAGLAFAEYFEALVNERRQSLGDDLLSALITAEAEGDRLNEDELFGTALLLLIAGHETTVNLIGNGMLALLRNRDEFQRLHDDPGLGRLAVDEALRYDSPVQMNQRIPLEPFTLSDGQVVEPAEQIIVMLAAANRDPAVFVDPDRFDIGRADAKRHLAFGGGIHHCLGAALARVEGEVALSTLVRRLPRMELTGEPERRPNFTLRGLARLPVSV